MVTNTDGCDECSSCSTCKSGVIFFVLKSSEKLQVLMLQECRQDGYRLQWIQSCLCLYVCEWVVLFINCIDNEKKWEVLKTSFA